MSDIQPKIRVAQLITGPNQAEGLFVKSEHGTFKTHEEAQKKALEVADASDQDAVITQDEEGFHVIGVDEVHTKLPGGMMGAEVVREAPIVSFVATDPLTGRENILGQQSAKEVAPTAAVRKTALDKYAAKYGDDLDEVLGVDKQAFIDELNQLTRSLEAKGISVTIEMDDDVFEYRDKVEGFRNMLVYAHENIDALKERSISQIAIVDEWDGIFGTKVDLDYDSDEGKRTLEIGDDFLNDWGESGVFADDKSLNKLTKEMGDTLTSDELVRRTEIYGEIKGDLISAHKKLTQLQEQSIAGEQVDKGPVIEAVEAQLKRLQNEVIPQAEDTFDDFSIKHERKLSLKYLETFEDTVSALEEQLEALKREQNMDAMELNARLEKAKITLVKGVKEIPDQRNYLGFYASGFGEGAKPSMGLQYSRSFGNDKSTIASVRAGTSAPLKSAGLNESDIMLGLGVSHTFHSRNKIVDGLNVGVGVGYSRETPFFIGVTASNNWYLTPYHGLEDELSVVGGLHATVGTYNNVGGHLQVHKQLSDKVDFEGYGELTLWNQAAEAEAEFAVTKNKEFYVTGGIGTNKLIYAGLGFADKYELEVGLGGVSFGKDSNNLPGETGWEVGVRNYVLPIPYFRHHRVPGYNFEYPDKSTEYITPNGTFMTIKKDEEGYNYREAYVPDPNAALKTNQLVYRKVHSKDELEDLENAPKVEVTVSSLGYLTVTHDGEKVVDDGLIVKELTEAELGIITDMAGVLWFDKMKRDDDHLSLGSRRGDMPLPLYRAVHY